MTLPTIIPLTRIDARYAPRPWPWAMENRASIEAYWTKLSAGNPKLFNGRVLIARDRRFDDGIYRAGYFDVDFASFIAWRDAGFPDESVSNGFAMAALRAGDGAYVLGVMGSHTANAGRIYFPAGTPDLDDVTADGRVDLAGSVVRELQEETGLDPDAFTATDTWTAVVDGQRTALMREVRSHLPADALGERIRGWLDRQETPELQGIHIARSPADIDERRMLPFMQSYLRHAFTHR